MGRSRPLSLPHSGTAGSLQHFCLPYSCVSAGKCMHTYVHLKQREKLSTGLIIPVRSVRTSKAPAHLIVVSKQISPTSLSKRWVANEAIGDSLVEARCSCLEIPS